MAYLIESDVPTYIRGENIMQFGSFDDKNKEYVIKRPDTPRSWSN
jgi:cellobiose phosphorylase